jgi:hypothetical protein
MLCMVENVAAADTDQDAGWKANQRNCWHTLHDVIEHRDGFIKPRACTYQ